MVGWGQLEEGLPLKRTAQSVLDLLKGEGETGAKVSGSSPLLAVHMLVSAMEGEWRITDTLSHSGC